MNVVNVSELLKKTLGWEMVQNVQNVCVIGGSILQTAINEAGEEKIYYSNCVA